MNSNLIEVYEIYANSNISLKEAALLVECHPDVLSKKWRALGLSTLKKKKITNKFSNILVEELYAKHLNGVSCKDLAKETGVHFNTLKEWFKEAGLNIQKYKPSATYKTNFDFFKSIDTEEKAYFLGLLLADGSVFHSGNSFVTSLGLKKTDSYLVEKLRDILSPDRPLYKKQHDMVSLEIHNCKLAQDLISWGCVPRKTWVKFKYPKISSYLNNHFIRGYLDGDGCCYTSEYFFKRKSGEIQSQFHRTVYWCSSNGEFLKNIQEILKSLNIKSRLEESIPKITKLDGNLVAPTMSIHRLTVDTKTDIIKLYEFLYANSTISLKRKQEIMYLCTLTPREIRELKASNPRNA